MRAKVIQLGRHVVLSFFFLLFGLLQAGEAGPSLDVLLLQSCKEWTIPVYAAQVPTQSTATIYFPNQADGQALAISGMGRLTLPIIFGKFDTLTITIDQGVFTWSTPSQPASLWTIFAGIHSNGLIWCSVPVAQEVVEATATPGISGELKKWFPVTVTLNGPQASETDNNPNPFLDFRLFVTFTAPSGKKVTVPGFFDGDGNGGGTGDIWRARFAPDETGIWNFEAGMISATNAAIELGPIASTVVPVTPQSGSFAVTALDPGAPGFYKWGALQYVGKHYLKFRDGPYFIKGGTDSPENLFGYAGFDNTSDLGCAGTGGLINGLHRYAPHVEHFGPAGVANPEGLGDADDPFFASAAWDSKGIIGALNYLASRHVNSIYFLPMNLGGDGCDTHPFLGSNYNVFDKTHYDISKLRQWNLVMEHATRRGIMLHFVLAEQEDANENWLDGGSLGVERKLFYRELIARFSHNLAIKWNLSEENDFEKFKTQQFADYIHALDPYDRSLCFHTDILPADSQYALYEGILGDPRFTCTSIQADPGKGSSNHVEAWRNKSANAGHSWVVEFDEQTEGLTDANETDLRKKHVWPVLLSGGGVELYAGYYDLPLGGDLNIEDFATRAEMWDYLWYARMFMEENLPFWIMSPADHLLTGEDAGTYTHGGDVFMEEGKTYAIYLPDANPSGSLQIPSGTYTERWYNPRTGTFTGSATTIAGGSVSLGAPPNSPDNDWVVLIQRQ